MTEYSNDFAATPTDSRSVYEQCEARLKRYLETEQEIRPDEIGPIPPALFDDLKALGYIDAEGRWL
jgi:hypothetical protein